MKQIESIFWGVIAAFGALFVQLIIYLMASFFQFNISATAFTQPINITLFAFIEEFFKYIIISKMLNNYSKGKLIILNSLLMTGGFSIIEFALLFTSNTIPTAAIAAELTILHLGTAGVIAYFIETSKANYFKSSMVVLMFATALHSAYNILILERQIINSYIIYALLAFLVAFNCLNLFRIDGKLARE